MLIKVRYMYNHTDRPLIWVNTNGSNIGFQCAYLEEASILQAWATRISAYSPCESFRRPKDGMSKCYTSLFNLEIILLYRNFHIIVYYPYFRSMELKIFAKLYTLYDFISSCIKRKLGWERDCGMLAIFTAPSNRHVLLRQKNKHAFLHPVPF